MGTVAEHVDGVYTGQLVGDMLHGPAKGEAVKALAAREGLDLRRCSAYSDSYNDLPMLSLVGDPCAINPDAKLRAHAREQGWRIRDYRTGRKALRAGLVAGGVAGAATGTVAAGLALRGRRTLTRASAALPDWSGPGGVTRVYWGMARMGSIREGTSMPPGGSRRRARARLAAPPRRRGPPRRAPSARGRARPRLALGVLQAEATTSRANDDLHSGGYGRQRRRRVRRRRARRLLGGGRGRAGPADRAGRARPPGRRRGVRAVSTTTTRARSTGSSSTAPARARSPRT